MMKLYWSDVLAPRKALSVARYLKAPVEFVFLDLGKGEHKAPDYKKLNPMGKVPTLVDGDRALTEADSIICYLSDKMRADLWPHDERQIDILRWFSWNAQHFTQAGGTLYFEHIIKKRFNIGPVDEDVSKAAVSDWSKCAKVLDAHLKGKKWLVGDKLSVADFSVAVCLPYADRAAMPINDYPEVARWFGQLNEIEVWREPFPAH